MIIRKDPHPIAPQATMTSSIPSATRRIPLLSPCSASTDLWSSFLTDATELDATGFPVRGSFGFCFSCFTDLSVATSEEARKTLATDTMRAVTASWGQTVTNRTVTNSVRQLLLAYTELQPGQIVAFKKGLRVIAIAQIVSPYRYEASRAHARVETGGHYPHRWDYVILRKATAAESAPMSGYIQTYYSGGFTYTEEPVTPTPAPAMSPHRAALIDALVEALHGRDEAEAALAAVVSRIADIQHQLSNTA
jgi:hypothetical protein